MISLSIPTHPMGPLLCCHLTWNPMLGICRSTKIIGLQKYQASEKACRNETRFNPVLATDQAAFLLSSMKAYNHVPGYRSTLFEPSIRCWSCSSFANPSRVRLEILFGLNNVNLDLCVVKDPNLSLACRCMKSPSLMITEDISHAQVGRHLLLLACTSFLKICQFKRLRSNRYWFDTAPCHLFFSSFSIRLMNLMQGWSASYDPRSNKFKGRIIFACMTSGSVATFLLYGKTKIETCPMAFFRAMPT